MIREKLFRESRASSCVIGTALVRNKPVCIVTWAVHKHQDSLSTKLLDAM